MTYALGQIRVNRELSSYLGDRKRQEALARKEANNEANYEDVLCSSCVMMSIVQIRKPRLTS